MNIQSSIGNWIWLVSSWYHYQNILDTSKGKNALKIKYCQKAIANIESELALLEKVFAFPERFIQKQIYKSDLYIIPKSKGLGIIGFVELVVCLFLLGEIYTSKGEKASLIDIGLAFEQMFNFSFGCIYKKRIALLERKACNLTKLLDNLKNLLIKESKNKLNEK